MRLTRRRGLTRGSPARSPEGAGQTERKGGAPGAEAWRALSGWIAGGRERWIRTAIVVIVCFGVGYFAAATWLFPAPEAAASAELVTVPDLVGQELEAAESAAAGRELVLSVSARIPHPRTAPGAVVAQSPLGGQLAAPGDTLRVALSSGETEVPVPALRGLSERRATAILEGLGFEARAETIPSLSAGVQETEPPAGTRLALPAEVLLRVGEGAPVVAVPDLRGLHIEDVEDLLEEEGLRLGSVRYDPGAPQAPGRIVGQSPPPGYSLRGGGLVSVEVAGPGGED